MAEDQDLLSPTACISYRLRRASRVAAKAYDTALKPVGLKNTQFTLLSALVVEGPKNIGELSEALATDGTTLTRNLEILVRRGLVENGASSADDRVRIVQASKQGENLHRKALPLWHQAQRSMLHALGEENWPAMMARLRLLEDAG